MKIYSSSIEGLDDVIKAFNKLANSEHHKHLVVAATQKTADRLLIETQKQLMANGSIRSGKLWSSLHVKPLSVFSKKYARDTLYVAFGVGPRYVTMNGPKGVNYGHLVELGHDLRRGRKQAFRLRKLMGRSPAKPYMRPAGDRVMNEHIKNVTGALNQALEEFGRD